MRPRHAPLAALAVALAFTGCREAKVAHYTVPKEKPPEMPGMSAGSGADMASTAVPTAQGAGLGWTAPADWEEKPASAMRRGSYTVKGADGAEADLSITAFPGDVGGELANLNRWRGQIQLPPLAESDLTEATRTIKVGDLDFVLVDFANPDAPKPQRILGAFTSFGGSTWFFKLMGPADLVEAAKPKFLTFIQSVTPPAPAPGASAPPAPAAPSAAPSAMAASTVPTAQGAGLTWTAPAAWTAKPHSAMRRGSYQVAGPNGAEADMSVTAFPGDVGGELANLNRWRGQIQLPPLAAADLPQATTSLQVGTLEFTVVDFSNPDAPDAPRILGAMVSYDGATWFFKLTGPGAAVGPAKADFLHLLQTVKTP